MQCANLINKSKVHYGKITIILTPNLNDKLANISLFTFKKKTHTHGSSIKVSGNFVLRKISTGHTATKTITRSFKLDFMHSYYLPLSSRPSVTVIFVPTTWAIPTTHINFATINLLGGETWRKRIYHQCFWSLTQPWLP